MFLIMLIVSVNRRLLTQIMSYIKAIPGNVSSHPDHLLPRLSAQTML